jgi:RHS repeat-associated protein
MKILKHGHRSLIAVIKALIVGLSIVTHVAAQTSTVTYFHNDLVGSPVAASDSSGTIIWRESYRPYGERLTNASASQDNSQWYTGHRQDAESGLVYMGARHYDPLIGRFLSIDPAPFTEGNPHSFNRYAYANNNPVKFVDPDGRAGVLLLEVAVATAILFVGYSLLPQRNKDRLREALTFSPSISPVPTTVYSDSAASGDAPQPSLVDEKGKKHILDGDDNGGGHRAGTGKKGKSEFPAIWSDDKILGEISDVATDPASSTSKGRKGRTVSDGTRGGVDIRTVQEPDGRIVTGFPTNGPKNE